MSRKTLLFGLAAVCAIAIAVACSGSPQTPTAPSASAFVSDGALNPDGSSLKITAPINLSPGGNETIDTRKPTLRFSNPAARFVTVGFAYELEVRDEPGNLIYSQVIGETPGQSAHELPNELEFDTWYQWRVRGRLGNEAGPWSTTAAWFRTPERPRSGGGGPRPGTLPRTPDPAPGQNLPLPNMFGVVSAVAAQHGDLLLNSCQEHGGTWDFMDVLVDTLRTFDDRWGYNWKRGNIGDPSDDVVDYHFGPGPSEGSIAVYIIDVIVGHCGSPGPSWFDVTGITAEGGSIGRWTGRGRFTN